MNEELTYEKAMTRLEEIVSLLEKNDVSLDDSIKLFEEGTKLTAFCSEKLKNAKEIHDRLEKYYIDAMDFGKVKRLSGEIVKEIFGDEKK